MKFLKSGLLFQMVWISAMIYGCGGGGGNGGTAPPVTAACSSYTTLTSSSKLKINVKLNGIYLISPAALSQSCLTLPAGLTLQNFKLQNFDPNNRMFIDIPVHFDSQGNIEFYGVGVNRSDYTSPNADYTETNVYWLIPATTTTPQMSTKPPVLAGALTAPMTTSHFEDNKPYWSGMLNGSGLDHWFWEVFSVTPSLNYTATINNYDSNFGNVPITLSFAITSQTAVSPHMVRALMTATAPAFSQSYSWIDTLPHIFSSTFSGTITNGLLSSLQFQNSSSGDQFYFNWFALEYPGMAYQDQLVFHGNISGVNTFTINGFSQNSVEIFDISNPANPQIIPPANIFYQAAGSGYQIRMKDNLSIPNNYIALTPAERIIPSRGTISLSAPADLKAIKGGYDYLVLTHENFLTNIQPLVDYRTSPQGGAHSVYVAKIGDVYDNYSGGIFSPQAIRDFLIAASAWTTSPQLKYVLLVGDASVDFKNYLGYGQENFIPTALIDYYYGQTVSDYWYVQNQHCNTSIGVSACNPIFSLGRLPGKTGAEIDTMVNKILGYEKNAPSNSWNINGLFVAAADDTATFENDSTTLSGYFPSKMNKIPLFYSVLGASTTSSMILSMNSGVLMTNYLGHGSVDKWANGFMGGSLGPTFFQSSMISNLTNSTKLTFLVTLNCLNGMFAGYGEGTVNSVSLAETFLKYSGGGAVAAFSPTGQGHSNYHMTLASQLYQTIFGTFPVPQTPVPIIGQAIQQAETAVLAFPGASSADLEMANLFVLLGDPATRLPLP